MIFRGAVIFGLTWLLVPHHPDLGLEPGPSMSDVAVRNKIMDRLREVRSEIKSQLQSRSDGLLVWEQARGVVLQKAGRPPDEDRDANPETVVSDLSVRGWQ